VHNLDREGKDAVHYFEHFNAEVWGVGYRGYISLFSYDNENSATVLTLWQDLESLNASEKGVLAGAVKKVQELLLLTSFAHQE